MAGGLGAAGFGAGFGRGLTNVLLQNRQDKAAKKEREFQALLPIHLQLAQETGDYSGLENLIGTFDPDLAQSLKKNSPFQQLHQFMGPQLQIEAQQPEMSSAGTVQQDVSSVESQALGEGPAPLPSRTVATQPVPGSVGPTGPTFFGSPVLTPTQKAERARDFELKGHELEIDARRKVAEKIGLPPDKALDYALYGTRPPAASQAATAVRFEGNIRGSEIGGDQQDIYGEKIQSDREYRVERQPDGSRQYIPTIVTGGPQAGIDFERAAQALGFTRYSEVPPDRRTEVAAKARELAQSMGQAGAYGRTTGQTQAQVDAIKGSGIVQTVIDNPVVWQSLPDAAKEKLAPLLAQSGFDFQRGTSMTPSMQAGVSRLKSSLTMLQQLEPGLTQKPGIAGRVAGQAQEWWAQLTGEDTPASIYRGISDSLLPALARASGEVGNLAEQEQTRYGRLAPKVSDPINVRQAKYAAIQYIIDAAGRGATAAQMAPFLDYMKFAQQGGAGSPGGRGAAPAGGGLTVKDGKYYMNGVLMPGQ